MASIEELMEKDTLQKITLKVGNYTDYTCPRCKKYIVIPAEAIAFYKCFHCWSCGQKLYVDSSKD